MLLHSIRRSHDAVPCSRLLISRRLTTVSRSCDLFLGISAATLHRFNGLEK